MSFSKSIVLMVCALVLVPMFLPRALQAQTQEAAQNRLKYEFLAPLPGFEATEFLKQDVGPGLFSRYLSFALRVIMVTIAVIAALMISIAGVQYIISGASESQRSDARGRIWDAVIGLLIALGSVFLINQANPDIFSKGFDAILRDVEITISPQTFETLNQGGLGLVDFEKDADLRDYFDRAGIGVNNEIACALPGGTPIPYQDSPQPCTTLAGLPDEAVLGLVDIKQECDSFADSHRIPVSGCAIVITGGTEPGHRTHGPGKAVVDIDKDTDSQRPLLRYITDEGRIDGGSTPYGTLYVRGNARYLDEGDHWHVVFSQYGPVEGDG